MSLMRTEPALLIGAIIAVANTLVGLVAVLLGWDEDLKIAAVAAVNAVMTFIGALITRSQVYAPATYEADVEEALYTPVPEGDDA